MTTVRCSVDTCHYWGEGEICQADSIWIKNNMREDADDDLWREDEDMEVGEIGTGGRTRRRGARSARTSAETCCETMRYRGTAKF